MDKIAKTTLSIMFIVLCGLISLALMEEERERKIEEIEKITEGKYTPASNWDNNVR